MDFGNRLAKWYQNNKRDLPWRHSNDPYCIWLSEIILQQTRVNQGLEYYLKFVEKYPDVFALAEAPRDEVFKLWQGLGYYNRADNMLATASIIAAKYDGKFPPDYNTLLEMPGIGPYTASAIASIAFNIPRPVIDGNVYRVLSRVFGIDAVVNSPAGDKQFWQYAESLLDRTAPGIYNQAIMEFGALQCTPANPDCENCIFLTECVAYSRGLVKELPVKKPRNKLKNRFFYYFVVELNSEKGKDVQVYVRKRGKGDIWKNLYDFLLVESDKKTKLNNPFISSVLHEKYGVSNITVKNISKEYIHKLTHQVIHAKFIMVSVDKKLDVTLEKFVILTPKNKLIDYPVPRLIEMFLKEYKIL